ncbi:hypothetical protein LSAT2_023868 [Lamellibrachia satsuma]|nr:hypothetical protein LSAT2_023868 [Lamellibrachia satsuma]
MCQAADMRGMLLLLLWFVSLPVFGLDNQVPLPSRPVYVLHSTPRPQTLALVLDSQLIKYHDQPCVASDAGPVIQDKADMSFQYSTAE